MDEKIGNINMTQNMISFYLMKNEIKNYEWGSVTSIQDLFEIDNSEAKPQAEIWMGSHENGSSFIKTDNKEQSLREFIKTNPKEILGERTSEIFNEQLPYLFKVLAAQKALSIQVHPSKKSAEQGYHKEELKGIKLNDYYRNYKDPNHKPELVYALTDFESLNGFISYLDVLKNFQALQFEEFEQYLSGFSQNLNEDGFKEFISNLLNLEDSSKRSVCKKLVELAKSPSKSNDKKFQLIKLFSENFSNDIGLFAPLFLNVVKLKPGEAMFLEAGRPHAYLLGTALEIMANSDNVLRAGLTPKNIDVGELVDNTTFVPTLVDKLRVKPNKNSCEEKFEVPVNDFKFSIFTKPKSKLVSTNSAEIIFAVDKACTLIDEKGFSISFEKGESVFIPAFVKQYNIVSDGIVARAFN